MRQLTEKELLVVEEFVKTGRVPKEMVEKMIRTEATGWAAAIADMDESQIKVRVGYSLNSFTYRHIGG
jgi:hypothetical protein